MKSKHTQEEHIKELSLKLAQTQEALLEQFYFDVLTSLPNLYKLRHDLEEIGEFTLIAIDIDNFKILNDFYGFVVGDFILESFASTLKEVFCGDRVYRIAGDEFAILRSEKMSFYALRSFLTELSRRFSSLRYIYAKTEIFIDCTLSSSASSSQDDIFSKVNMALKYAKSKRLKFWIYEDVMQLSKEYEANLKYATTIRKAIVEHSGIVPYFQPIVDNKTEKIVKFETLSRLIDAEGGIHAPNSFIPVAKTIKVYDKVTMTIIEKSFEIFSKHTFDFSVNLSFEDIINPQIADFIIQTLHTSGLGERVTFELLESDQVNDFTQVVHFFNEIRRYGAKVAIDDFGSGFSNFSYIIKLNPDFLKIDGSLIANLDTDKNAQIIVETIVDFSRKLGIQTVAEFVHSSTVLSMVKQLGIDFSQGYFIDRPSPQIPS